MFVTVNVWLFLGMLSEFGQAQLTSDALLVQNLIS